MNSYCVARVAVILLLILLIYQLHNDVLDSV